MDTHFYRVRTWRIFDRIAQQVDEDLAQAVFVSEQTGRGCTMHHDGVRRVQLLYHLCTLLEDLVQIHALLNVPESTCLQVGDVEQVSVQSLQFVDLRFHLRQD